MTMTPTNSVKDAIQKFEGVTWINYGDPEHDDLDDKGLSPGWVKFGIEKSELGWRTIEFLAWVFNALVQSKYRLFFWPTSPPPYINEPGTCLSFVVEMYLDTLDNQESINRIAGFINEFRSQYWADCKP